MVAEIDPKQYGISARTILLKDKNNHFILLIDRKSRIIMKDAKIIVEKARMIKRKVKTAKISLKTTAPVCSKSILMFQENEIALQMVESLV